MEGLRTKTIRESLTLRSNYGMMTTPMPTIGWALLTQMPMAIINSATPEGGISEFQVPQVFVQIFTSLPASRTAMGTGVK